MRQHGTPAGHVCRRRQVRDGLVRGDERAVLHRDEAVALEARPVVGRVDAARGGAAPEDGVLLVLPRLAVALVEVE